MVSRRPYPGQRFITTKVHTFQGPKGPVHIPIAGHLIGPGPKRIETMHRKIAKDRDRKPKASVPGGERRRRQVA